MCILQTAGTQRPLCGAKRMKGCLLLCCLQRPIQACRSEGSAILCPGVHLPPGFDRYNLSDHLCIAQLSLRHYNLLCFGFLSFALNQVASSPSCYGALFQLNFFLYNFDKYFRAWARKALKWNISFKGLSVSQSLLNNNKCSSVIAFLTDLFSAPVPA